MARPLAVRVKEEAARLGFCACSIAPATPSPETRQQFDERLDAGFLDGLPWLDRARARRATEPTRLLANARSIVSVAASYGHQGGDTAIDGELRGRIASYAWGRDYHRVIERQLRSLCTFIDQAAPGSHSRILVDYGPLAERAYAARAGLGWFGKSTNLLLPRIGSWVLLGEVLTTVPLDADLPIRKSCGACRRCVAACPTGALVDGYILHTERCISYQTIENRGPIPRDLRPLIGDWLFGCDVCQESCPVGANDAAPPLDGLDARSIEDRAPALISLLQLTHEDFRNRFAGRAIMRAKRDGLVRNACVVLGNLGDMRAVPALAAALSDGAALVRGHAAWALGRLGGPEACTALEWRRGVEEDRWVLAEISAALAGCQASRAHNPSA